MRFPSLLVLSLFCLPSLCVGESGNQSEPSRSSELAFASPLPSSNSLAINLTDRLSDLRRHGRILLPELFDQDGPSCYAMRTYTLRRVSPDSDETRPFRYSTCPQAWRFELRHADGNVDNSQPDSNGR